METVRQHQEGGRWTSTNTQKIKIEEMANILTLEAKLQPSQTSTAGYSWRNSQNVVIYFRRKAPPQTSSGL